MRIYVLAAAALAVVSVQGAVAQTPSADDIIAGLRPSAQQLTGPTRGIRRLPVMATPSQIDPVDPAPARAPRHVAAQPSPADEQSDASGPSMKLVVDFRPGSAELTPSATRTLDQLGKALASDALGSFRFRVEGHTDTVGSSDANKDLSQRRAEMVASYLESRFGISEARLQAVGLGSTELLVPTPDQTAEPRNRRVRIVNLGT